MGSPHLRQTAILQTGRSGGSTLPLISELLLLVGLSLLISTAVASEPEVQSHYAKLAALSSSPDPKLAALDQKKFLASGWTDFYRQILDWKPIYLEEDWAKNITLPSPPANSSAQTQAELRYLLALQDRRSAAEISLIKTQHDFDLFYLLRAVDPAATQENRPKTLKLLQRVSRDLHVTCFTLKNHFSRIRPAALELKLKPVLATPPHPAYPSGHATTAYVFAYVLQEIFPLQRDILLKTADSIAWNREVAGFHYPSDTIAGQLLAKQLVNLLLQYEQFKSDLQEAQEENATVR